MASQVPSRHSEVPAPAHSYSVLGTRRSLVLARGGDFPGLKQPEVEGRIRVRQAYALLDEGRYTRAVERLEKRCSSTTSRSAAGALLRYLARRDLERRSGRLG